MRKAVTSYLQLKTSIRLCCSLPEILLVAEVNLCFPYCSKEKQVSFCLNLRQVKQHIQNRSRFLLSWLANPVQYLGMKDTFEFVHQLFCLMHVSLFSRLNILRLIRSLENAVRLFCHLSCSIYAVARGSYPKALTHSLVSKRVLLTTSVTLTGLSGGYEYSKDQALRHD